VRKEEPMKLSLPTTANPTLLVACAMVAVLAAAGLLWLQQSSALATTGQRIWSLDRERQALLERRSEALLAYAAATDPARLEARARALGFAPVGQTQVLAVPSFPAGAVVAGLPADSALAITAGATVLPQAVGPSLTERILALGVNEASAAERTVPSGVGGAP
jgi:hypothetical protein